MKTNAAATQKVAFTQSSLWTAIPAQHAIMRITISLFVSVWWLMSQVGLLGQIIVVNDSDGDGISDGPRQLLPETAGQQIRIYVTGGTLVEGVNFNVQVADGYPDSAPGFPGVINGPNITAVDIVGPVTIFFGNNTTMQTVRSSEQVWSVSTTTNPGTFVSAQGLLGIVTVTTVGWSSGTWDFNLQSTQEGTTDFTLVPATIT